jgi:predicted acylesterase/phospholipase RssA
MVSVGLPLHAFSFLSQLMSSLFQHRFANDLTFEEAYKKTGRIYCITLASTTKKAPPVLINYISAPNVTIASAVVASAAVPGFIA